MTMPGGIGIITSIILIVSSGWGGRREALAERRRGTQGGSWSMGRLPRSVTGRLRSTIRIAQGEWIEGLCRRVVRSFGNAIHRPRATSIVPWGVDGLVNLVIGGDVSESDGTLDVFSGKYGLFFPSYKDLNVWRHGDTIDLLSHG